MTPDASELLALGQYVVERFEPMGRYVVFEGDALLDALARMMLRFARADIDSMPARERWGLAVVLERVNAVAQVFYFYNETEADAIRRPAIH